MSKKTIVLGASNNPSRYSYKACIKLLRYGHEIFPMGIKNAEISGIKIINDLPEIKDINTVTLYIGPEKQDFYSNYILNLNPKRVIFNPGTENASLIDLFEQRGIKCVQDCTLVMLSQGIF